MKLLNIYSELYWLTRLNGIKDVVNGLSTFCFLIAAVLVAIKLIGPEFDEFKRDEEVKLRKQYRQNMFRKIYWVIPTGFLFVVINTLLPTKNEYIFIVAGGKTINWIKQDSSIRNIPGKTTELIYEFLDKQVKELKSEK